MYIVHVGTSRLPVLSSHGGAIERRIREVASVQAAQGNHVTVFSLGDADREIDAGGYVVKELHCGLPYPMKHLQFQIRSVRGFMQHHISPEVVHFHSQPEGAFIALPARVKCVLSYDFFKFRRADSGPLFGLYRAILKRFDKLLPVSDYCLGESRQFWKLPSEYFEVIPNGVNPEQFHPDRLAGTEECKRAGIAGPTILYVGRICEQKGSDVLLQAYELIRQKRPDIALVLCGPIGQFENVQDPRGWAARIAAVGGVYLGAVPDARLRGVYNMADLFVMPTVREEMFCMAAVEAEACGIPVLASDHGGLREVVPVTAGSRFEPGNPVALAAAALQILGDGESRKKLASGAFENSRQYHWSHVCEMLETTYRGL